MTLDNVIHELISLHRETQVDGGFDDASEIAETTCPLDDLQGFDSLLIPQLIRQLAKNLGRPFEKGERVKNLYRVANENQTIRQIAERFKKVYVKEAVKA
jgi:hypothetical protein